MTLEEILRVTSRKKLCLPRFLGAFHSIQELDNVRQILPHFYIISFFRLYWNVYVIQSNKQFIYYQKFPIRRWL